MRHSWDGEISQQLAHGGGRELPTGRARRDDARPVGEVADLAQVIDRSSAERHLMDADFDERHSRL